MCTYILTCTLVNPAPPPGLSCRAYAAVKVIPSGTTVFENYRKTETESRRAVRRVPPDAALPDSRPHPERRRSGRPARTLARLKYRFPVDVGTSRYSTVKLVWPASAYKPQTNPPPDSLCNPRNIPFRKSRVRTR